MKIIHINVLFFIATNICPNDWKALPWSRSSGARLSSYNQANNRPIMPKKNNTKKIPRQSVTNRSHPPITGARIGPKPENVCTMASTASLVLPEKSYKESWRHNIADNRTIMVCVVRIYHWAAPKAAYPLHRTGKSKWLIALQQHRTLAGALPWWAMQANTYRWIME